MTEAELDHVYELREKIEAAVKALVDEALKNETAEIDDLVRMQMTENFRFWK